MDRRTAAAVRQARYRLRKRMGGKCIEPGCWEPPFRDYVRCAVHLEEHRLRAQAAE